MVHSQHAADGAVLTLEPGRSQVYVSWYIRHLFTTVPDTPKLKLLHVVLRAHSAAHLSTVFVESLSGNTSIFMSAKLLQEES